MSNNIVTVQVSQTIGAIPSTLQRTGAFVSQGATATAPGTLTLLTQLADLTDILNGSHAITSITSASGTATATTTAPHGFTVSDSLELTIAGASNAAFNGIVLATITGASTFTYSCTVTGSAAGTLIYTVEDVAELLADVTTFYAQGNALDVYVFECGPGNAADGTMFLGTWITANPHVIYAWFVPNLWDGDTSFLALVAGYESPSSMTYFWVTTTLASYGAYTTLMKDVVSLVEAPAYQPWVQQTITSYSLTAGIMTVTFGSPHGVAAGQWFTLQGTTVTGGTAKYNGTFQALPGTAGTTLLYAQPGATGGTVSGEGSLRANYYTSAGTPSTEQSLASAFYTTLNYNPSSTNKVTPLAFSYEFGVTPFPTPGNGAVLQALKTASVNYIDTGSEGGIVNTILKWGHTMDGRPFNHWYSVDYAQIGLQQTLANEVINGSNNPINPLYLNQDGINRLQARAAQFMGSMITVGLALGARVIQTELSGADFDAAIDAGTYAGNVVVNAVPFADYYASNANPNDYKIGVYNGLAAIYAPLRGFESVLVNLNVTDIVAP